jgi:hypothetical protein
VPIIDRIIEFLGGRAKKDFLLLEESLTSWKVQAQINKLNLDSVNSVLEEVKSQRDTFQQLLQNPTSNIHYETQTSNFTPIPTIPKSTRLVMREMEADDRRRVKKSQQQGPPL